MVDRIAELRQQGEAAVAGATDTAALEDVRVRFLGRKAELPNLLRGVAQLPPEERGAVGRAANEARRALDAAIEARREALEGAELESRLAADVLDVTLPGSPVAPVGRHHLITATRREIEDVFMGLGFRVVERLARLVGGAAHSAALLRRQLRDAAQQVRQLGLAAEEAHAHVLQRGRVGGARHGGLALLAELGDPVDHGRRILRSSS